MAIWKTLEMEMPGLGGKQVVGKFGSRSDDVPGLGRGVVGEPQPFPLVRR